MSTLSTRAAGTPFAILYEPRSTPDSKTPPAKPGPKTAGLQNIQNSKPFFNVAIPNQEASDRTNSIKGKL